VKELAALALRPRSSSALHAMRGRDRDLVRPGKRGTWPAGVPLNFAQFVPWAGKLNPTFHLCRPALTLRWTRN